MNFSLTDYHWARRDEFRRFAATELDTGADFPRNNLQKIARCGYMGLPIPVRWGGAGDDFISYVLLVEEVSRICASTGVIVAVHTSVGTMPLLYYGTREQKELYLPALARGEMLGAFALTESGAGSDAAALSAKAEAVNGGYRLNGCKIFITSGGEADLYTVYATLDRSKGRRGITAFLVEKDSPGLCAGPPEKKMGLNRSHTTELMMEDLFVPMSKRLGGEGEGFSIAMALLDGGRIGIAAQGLGLAAAALDHGISFLRKQKEVGELIGQGEAFALAGLATRLEAARLLVYRAAALKESGRDCATEAAMAKMYATDLAMAAATKALDFCGLESISGESPLARYFCDAKVTQIYEGTNQVQRLVIAREILKKH